jgi:hypothetical protein
MSDILLVAVFVSQLMTAALVYRHGEVLNEVVKAITRLAGRI